MNILITMGLWDNKNAAGNTFSNWFEGNQWEKDQFSNLFWRAQNPANNVCADYYRITDLELLKKFLVPETIGEHFTYQAETEPAKDNRGRQERKMIAWLHAHPLHLIYGTMEFLQRNVKWQNKKFINYLTTFSPDVFFTTAAKIGITPKLLECVRKHSNAKIVYYIADDVYGQYVKYPFYRRYPLTRMFEKAIQSADKLYGASEQLCEEYGKRFNVEITPLYKGCVFSPMQTSHNDVIKLVYAGNLFHGRVETITTLAEAIQHINKDVPRAMLEIYTGTPVSEELKKKLNLPGASQIMGQRSYEEIKEILCKADIVLHVESFQQQKIELVRYSFSTKIIDCFQSGSVTMAIGPSGIASIEYVRNTPGAIVVDDLQMLEDSLRNLIEKKEKFSEMAAQTREFAVRNHDIYNVQKRLRADFEELLKTGR